MADEESEIGAWPKLPMPSMQFDADQSEIHQRKALKSNKRPVMMAALPVSAAEAAAEATTKNTTMNSTTDTPKKTYYPMI